MIRFNKSAKLLFCSVWLLSFGSEVFSADFSASTIATGNQVKAFAGTDQVKLVFQNKGFLYLVDFTATGDEKPVIKKMPQTVGAVVPNISPDGEWLVFGKGPSADMSNNESIKSSAFVTALDISAQSLLVAANNAHEPRFQTDSDHGKIIYSTLGKWAAWNGLGEVRSKSWNGTAFGDENVVTNKGSFYGGFNGHYLASGSDQAVLLDVSKPENMPDTAVKYALYKKSTDTWNYEPRQFCNPSISPSLVYPGVLMGLDFGSSGRTNDSINSGKAWGIHDIILLANNDGKILKTILRPEIVDLPGIDPGDGSLNPGQHWDDPEWSNNPYFAVANLQVSRSFDPAGTGNWQEKNRHERIFLVNIKESSYLELVRSDDLTLQSATDMQWPTINIQGGATEEDGWMDNTSIRTPRTKNQNRQDRVYLKGNTLYFDKSVESVQLLDLNGKVVFDKLLKGEKVICLDNVVESSALKILIIKGSDGLILQQLVYNLLK